MALTKEDLEEMKLEKEAYIIRNKDMIRPLSQGIAKANKELQSIEDRIKKLDLARRKRSKSDINVTDHAIIRFIERSDILDVDLIRKEILSVVEANGGVSGDFKIIKDGYKYVIQDSAVVTIIKI